jgi:3-oxoacyl-[acyl-carrier protein] reductase
VHYHREKASAELLLQYVTQVGGSGSLYQADVRDADSVQHMVGAFSRDHQRPIGFVCAAGIGGGQLALKLREDEWQNVLATNLTGLFHCLRAMAPRLQVQGGGSIVVVGSYAGYQGMTGQAAYAASKAGLVGLVKTAALEWGQDSICVNLVLPGWQRTKLSDAAMPGPQAWRDHALGRPPALDEVARTVVHLAHMQDVSGQVWNCDSRSVSL